MAVNLSVTPADRNLIALIAARAQSMDAEYNDGAARDRIEWMMDFSAVHANGNPLRLAELLEADNFNFAHDAFGIARNLNRETGEIENCFRPRFSVPAMAA